MENFIDVQFTCVAESFLDVHFVTAVCVKQLITTRPTKGQSYEGQRRTNQE
jgi:hypothetical protein